jgi:hypothetical protein
MANVMIDIAAEFVGNKAFKQADSATDKLTRSVKRLAGAVGIAFSAQAIVNFGKLAVRSSLEQQAEQNRLNQLLKVGVGATKEEIDLLNEQAKALERIGVVSGGNITQTQSQLATFNLQVSTIKALTPAILDYVTAEKGATASTEDFKSMTNGLAQALNGNFASLTRVGFVLDENTKKQIANGSEMERTKALIKVLNSTYKDFNKNLRETDAGQMQVLANSAQEATTIIGTGLIDALKTLGKDNSVDELAANMESAALDMADFVRGLGQIAAFEVGGKDKSLLGLLFTPFQRSISAGPLGAIARLGEAARTATDGLNFTASSSAVAFEKGLGVYSKIVKNAKVLTAEEQKQLKARQLKNAIDKANLALGKGTDVFDLEKIQLRAAEINQAEQLGKLTNQAQLIQITNDLARLRIKQSILALDEAIASEDVKAITAATNRLNEDLKIFGALSNQKIKLAEIETILKGIAPKDLINLENLNQALALLKLINTGTPASAAVSMGAAPVMPSSLNGMPIGRGPIGGMRPSAGFTNEELQYFEDINQYQFGGSLSGFTPTTSSAAPVNITVNTGVGDPNAIAEAIDDVLRQARSRGTLVAIP